MQNNKCEIKQYLTIVLIALVATLLIGASIFASKNNNQENASTVDNKKGENKEIHEDKTAENPVTFQPTEKVTADQAVAFPADI